MTNFRQIKGIDPRELKRPVKIYDVVNKKLITVCESVCEAQRYTGVKNVFPYIVKKTRSHKNKLGITICFR